METRGPAFDNGKSGKYTVTRAGWTNGRGEIIQKLDPRFADPVDVQHIQPIIREDSIFTLDIGRVRKASWTQEKRVLTVGSTRVE